jgi:hypothetical protein
MKTRRLTKKYKNKSSRKSNSKSRKSNSKSRKRILKGGVPPRGTIVSNSRSKQSPSSRPPSSRPPSSRPPSSRPPSSRPPSSRPSSRPSSVQPSRPSSIFKKPVKTQQEVFIDVFFRHIRESEFPEALCALYKFYTQFPYSEINSTLLSRNFKEKYDKTFYRLTQKVSKFGVSHCETETTANYVYFLSYIFKKVAEGGSIVCNGKKLSFVYSKDKNNPTILTILKRFLIYLDGACFTTVSYTITADRYNQISRGLGTPPNKEEKALYEIVSSLILLQTRFPSLEHILDNMTTHNLDKSIASYSINTTVLSRIIKQSYTDFLEQIKEE